MKKEFFSFCVLADPHCAETAWWKPEVYGNHIDRFFACVAEMDKLKGDNRPDFMLIIGDVHLWELEKHLSRTSMPMHVISGNHEGTPDRKKQMRELFPDDFKRNGKESDYYSFVHKGVRFIGLCDAPTSDHIGSLCSEYINPRGQCEWLEKELAQKETKKIIFAHIPPQPESKDQNSYLARNDSRWFLELVKKAQPLAMFFGHSHKSTIEYKFGKTRSFTVRSCAWNFSEVPLGFLMVKILPKGMEIEEIII